jgi:energy-coupling factor transporter ATP-binding protein EcfA2
VAEALRAVDLARQLATPAGELDAGQRKRAAIAAELLAEPAQLFLEEPTIGLDPAQGAEVMRRLRRLCDNGTTVVLTTQNPLDAVRCDKVAVLATGGHLAFFGTPKAACDYFAADSLDEIYERLAGLGDPAAAWSRRFPQFSRTVPGFTPAPAFPPLPGSARLVPDMAGPHSAGRASADPFAGAGSVGTDLLDDPLSAYDLEVSLPAHPVTGKGAVTGTGAGRAAGRRMTGRLRQWWTLARRNVDALALAVRPGGADRRAGRGAARLSRAARPGSA